jgi:hypothetical protein
MPRLRPKTPRSPSSRLVPENRPEAFLLEVLVIGQHVCQTFAAHGLHGDAIRKAVAFVRPGLIKFKSGEERLPALRNQPDSLICKQFCHSSGGAMPQVL